MAGDFRPPTFVDRRHRICALMESVYDNVERVDGICLGSDFASVDEISLSRVLIHLYRTVFLH
jgi:hypothetical protein